MLKLFLGIPLLEKKSNPTLIAISVLPLTCIKLVSSVFKVATATPQLNLLSTNVPVVFFIGTPPFREPTGYTDMPYDCSIVLNRRVVGTLVSNSHFVLSFFNFQGYTICVLELDFTFKPLFVESENKTNTFNVIRIINNPQNR